MSLKNSRNITFEEFGDLLQHEMNEGNIGDEVQEVIQAGLIPIKLLREKLRWIIEREGNGLRLTVADALKIPDDNDSQDSFDLAA
jgi:hypothetical protein